MGFISKGIFEDILSLVLQNRIADIDPMSDPQNEALLEILNPGDVFAIIPTSTCHGKSIIFQCLPDLCRNFVDKIASLSQHSGQNGIIFVLYVFPTDLVNRK